jgi:LacI family transcriptional regulator
MKETHPLPRRAALPVVVASCLRERLARGDWLHLLPGELELARELQVGRNTVRSALAVLEMEGLIRTANGRRREVVARAGTPRPPLVNTAVLLLPAPLHTLPPSALLWMDHLRSWLSPFGVRQNELGTW